MGVTLPVWVEVYTKKQWRKGNEKRNTIKADSSLNKGADRPHCGKNTVRGLMAHSVEHRQADPGPAKITERELGDQ